MADIQVIIDVIGKEDMLAATRAADRMRKQYRDLDNQFNKGKINAQQYATGISQVDKRVDQLAASHQRGVAQVNRFGQAMHKSTRRVNAGGLMMQQTGYQIGDFIVQVQSGTNAFVAFGQQATQVAGTLTLLQGKWILIGSVLGITIPLLTAIGAAWMRTRQAQDAAGNSLSYYREQLKSAKEEIISTAYELDALTRGFTDNSEFALVMRVEEAREELEQTLRDLESLLVGDTESGQAQTRKTYEAQIEAAREALRLAEQQLGTYRLQRDAVTEIKRAEEERTRQLEERAEVVERIRASVQEETSELQNQVALLTMSLQFGRDSAAVEALKRQQAEETYRAYLTQQDILGNNQEALVTMWQTAQRLTEEADSQQRILEQIANLDMPITAKIELLAGALGVANSAASALLGTLSAVGQTYGNVSALSGMDGVDLIAPFSGPRPPARPDDIDFGYNPPSVSGGGGGGGGSSGPTTLERLQKEVEERRTLLTLYGQQRMLQEEIYAVTKKLGDEAGSMSAQQIEDLAKINLELDKQEELYAKRLADIQSIADTMSQSMGDAFASMVDGTKSFGKAIRDMAREVIKQLWDIFVIQRLIGSFDTTSNTGTGIMKFFSFLTNANGNAFSNGKVTAFADGGVVNSPTFFPMANGMGLMGEAGPEAVMPLKRGKNGKLGVQVEGGQGNVVVNQTFAFSANGDDSVKRIIAEQAPKIAALTQKTMMDSRRRGGVTRATFG
jgi:DNA repair exonuclease SbcCD ATPase subunit